MVNSKQLLLAFQADNGAFPAAPDFAPYRYCWLRDGSFVAYALTRAGEEKAAARYFNWVNRVIRRYQQKIFDVVVRANSGEKISPNDMLHTRYTLAGYEGEEPWGNFQLDGYASYLWALSQFTEQFPRSRYLEDSTWAVQLTAEYLIRFWHTSCLDCWEEKEGVHAATLAAVYGGLAAQLAFMTAVQRKHAEEIIGLIPRLLKASYIKAGHFVSDPNTRVLDSSLIWLAVPFQAVHLGEKEMVETVAKIEETLTYKGGIKRYAHDTYYGGGAWLPLTAWLGWYFLRAGDAAKAKSYLNWVEQQADNGKMPEQLVDPQCPHCSEWEEKWGKAAAPLLWSHAMHLVLKLEVDMAKK